MIFEIPNWKNLQGYKSDNPAWIKLYTKLLTKESFMTLPSEQKWALIGLWMLASRSGGRIEADERWIKRLLCVKKIDVQTLSDRSLLLYSQEGNPRTEERRVEESRGEEIRRDGSRSRERSISDAYLKVWNEVYHRHSTNISDVMLSVGKRLDDGIHDWQIIAAPIIAWVKYPKLRTPDKIKPLYPLRDGRHPKVRDGNTYGATDWIREQAQDYDHIMLDSRLVAIAEKYGVWTTLKNVGVKEQERGAFDL